MERKKKLVYGSPLTRVVKVYMDDLVCKSEDETGRDDYGIFEEEDWN